MSKPFDVFFWDFGGVFTGSPFGPGNSAYAESLGTDLETITDLVFGYHTPDGDHPWHRVERGEMALTDGFKALTASIDDAGIEGFHLKDFFAAMSSKPGSSKPGSADEEANADKAVDDAPLNPAAGLAKATARPEMVSLVKDLADVGVRHCIITNNVKEFASGWQQMMDLTLFEEVIDSSAVGLRKPDPAIYHLALERMGNPAPERTAFLDDFAGNLDSAAKLGIHTVLVDPDPAAAIASVRSLMEL